MKKVGFLEVVIGPEGIKIEEKKMKRSVVKIAESRLSFFSFSLIFYFLFNLFSIFLFLELRVSDGHKSQNT